jgi:hypothetical protein
MAEHLLNLGDVGLMLKGVGRCGRAHGMGAEESRDLVDQAGPLTVTAP